MLDANAEILWRNALAPTDSPAGRNESHHFAKVASGAFAARSDLRPHLRSVEPVGAWWAPADGAARRIAEWGGLRGGATAQQSGSEPRHWMAAPTEPGWLERERDHLNSDPQNARPSAPAEPLTFAAVYEAHFPFVWRSARRLGIPDSALDDVVQEIFIVVHRRLPDFEGRSTLKTWLFGIVLRVVRDHRRTRRRKPTDAMDDPDAFEDLTTGSPHDSAEKAQAVRVLHALLSTLDDDKREAFVMSELEQLSMPEIAEATGVNVNTVYSRVRAARRAFDLAVSRHRAVHTSPRGRGAPPAPAPSDRRQMDSVPRASKAVRVLKALGTRLSRGTPPRSGDAP